jgi:hypothetical protein
MTARFSILVRERLGDGREVELAQVDRNPEAVVKALWAKKTKRSRPRFVSIRIVDRHAVTLDPVRESQ